MVNALKSVQPKAKKDKGTAKEGQRTVYLTLEQVNDMEKIADELGIKKFSEVMRLIVKSGIKSTKEKLFQGSPKALFF